MKKILMSTLTTGLAFAMIANTGTAYAENFDESNELPQKENTKATVTFTAPNDAVDIVDPLDPSKPGDVSDPKDGNITRETGPLTLDYASHIEFGSNPISSVSKDYYAKTPQPYIQVSDRSGRGNGWHVDVSVSSFKNESGNILEGATLAFKNGTSISDSKYNKEKNTPEVRDLVLTANDESSSATIVNAEGMGETGLLNTAQGVGTWVVRWLSGNERTAEENVNVVLNVPGGVASADSMYTSQIEWTLTDGPETTTEEDETGNDI